MKQSYVTALTNSILGGIAVEEALTNVKMLLIRRGHQRIWPQILRATKRVLEARLKSSVPQVAVAKSGTVPAETIKSALLAISVAENDAHTITEDSTLVGGFTARFKGTLLDKSYKRVLVDLYRNITKS
ncbi:MAG: ATP synthase subunit delta [Syntrophomonadaceae bacterium]|nr:ATP synthase subunit delta [Bacillota bacterium]